MATTSQFTIYYSTDSNAPQINGLTGSLIAILDACLVSGSVGGKSPAGWSKPFPNTTSLANGTASFACYLQGTGSAGSVAGQVSCSLFVNDSQPTGGGFSLARVTGYEVLTGITGGNPTGSGVFPISSSGIVGPTVPWFKSTAQSSTARAWTLMADSRTVYFFSQPDGASYNCNMFGDIYSYNPNPTGPEKCIIVGMGTGEVSAITYNVMDVLSNAITAQGGHFAARSFSGRGGSITIAKVGDQAKNNGASGLRGTIQYPNGPDGSAVLSPVWIVEPATNPTFKGVLRGFWQICHAIGNFTNNQVISGSGNISGSYQLIFPTGGAATTLFCMEVSNTVLTN